MGIKGIYGEIGPGMRIALAKLANDSLVKNLRPLRIAIDVSIWQFQTLAGQGGTNPAIRTFYYRLLRLLSISVQPLFVFDGPHKPKFKRNKRVGQGGAMVPNLLTKQLLKLFGFPFHTAPGEAEAECALLQREGIVDAVLSEDVDTLMFGCGITLRNWSSEGARGNKSPTHVNLYNAKATKEGQSGLDRQGMILIAMMSGGDYITEGIPGCGIKIACEAARAGFGKRLCQIPRSDAQAFANWRKDLAHEIHTNESKYFRMKHKALSIPENFPNKEVLDLYTHPVVSSASKVDKLKEEILWGGEVDVLGLRTFVADAFEWTHKIGAFKFIRGLAPVLLVHKLRLRADRRSSGYGDVVLTAINEMEYVRSICGQRTHFSTDGVSELRVVYHPNDIVGLDLEAELDDSNDIGRDGLAPINDDDQIEAYVDEDVGKRGPSHYDPTQLDKIWILHTVAKMGIPLKVEDYEESLRAPKKTSRPKAPAKTGKKTKNKAVMPQGAMDRFVKITKSVQPHSMSPKHYASDSSLPPSFLAPALEAFTPDTSLVELPTDRSSSSLSKSKDYLAKPTQSRSRRPKTTFKASRKQVSVGGNPWTLSQTQPKTPPRITKPTQRQSTYPKRQSPSPLRTVIDLLSSSPEISRSSPPPTHSNLPTQQIPTPLYSAKQRTRMTIPQGGEENTALSIPSSEHSDMSSYSLPPLPSTVTRTRGSRTIKASENLLLIPSSPLLQSPLSSSRKRHSSSFDLSNEDDDLPTMFSSPTSRVLNFSVDNNDNQQNSSTNDDTTHGERSKKSSFAPESIINDCETTTASRSTTQSISIDLSSSPLPSLSSQRSRNPSLNQQTQSMTTADSNKKNTKKKLLMLRESIGGFQEIDEDEWEHKQGSTSSRNTVIDDKNSGGARGKGRGERKARRVLRVSQVEVLDLRDVD